SALVPDGHGMSLLLTTPYLLLALWPRRVSRLEGLGPARLPPAPGAAAPFFQQRLGAVCPRFALGRIRPGVPGGALRAGRAGAARAPLALVVALTGWGVAVGAWGLQWFKANTLH